MEILKKNFRRVLMLTGILVFALSISVFAAEIPVSTSGDFVKAINEAKSGDKIVLTNNINLEQGVVIEGKSLTIDLGDNNVVSAPCDVFTVKNANVTFAGTGTITEGDEASYGAVIVRGSENVADTNYTTVNVGKNVTLIGWAPICIRQNDADKGCGVTVNVYGTLTGINDAGGGTGAGIYINGSIQDKENYPVINIYPGAKLSGTGLGIFAMGYAKWNIEGASIEGVESGIGIKAGIWNISGNTIVKGTGEDSTPTQGYSNGINASGAAIQIESNSDYAKEIELNIIGGEFISENSYSIYEYLKAGETNTAVKSIDIKDGKFSGGILTSKELDDIKEATFKISGGYFSSDPTEYLVEGKKVVISDNQDYAYMVIDKEYVAQIGDDKYYSLAEAFEYAQNGNEIILVNDVNVEDNFIDLNDGNEYTLNLNGHTISSTLNPIFKLKSGKLNLIDTAEEKGKISGTKGIIWVFGDEANNRELVINEGVVLETVDSMCVYVCNKNSILRTAGDLLSVNDATIKGFGTKGYGDVKVYITGGKVISENGVGMYLPNSGDYEITGGYIKGPTAIYQKAGNLIVSGDAVIEADGEKSDYAYNGSGCHITGDAIVLDNCGFPGGTPSASILGGYIKSANNKAIASYSYGDREAVVEFVSGGYFSSDPTEYLVEGKASVKSDDPNYAYMVAEKLVDVDTAVEAGDPAVVVPEGMEIESGDFAADTTVLESVASSLANDVDVIGESGDVFDALDAAVSGDISNEEIIVVVQPYIDVQISEDSTTSELVLEIDLKYNVIARVSGDEDIVTSGDADDINAVVLKSGEKLDVSEEVEITIPLPTGFAQGVNALFVHHIKGDRTYIYETEIDGNLLKFINPHGFSPFIVTTEGGAVINETTSTRYDSLEAAIAEVNSGDTIKLLADNEEQVTVSEDIIFSINKDVYVFSGDVVAGANTTKTETENGSVIVYEFDYTKPAPRPSTGGGSSTPTYRITVTQTEGGKISPKSTNVEEGDNQKFAITPNEGYEIKDVIVDAVSVGKVSEYTFEDVSEKHSITAVFAKIEAKEEWVNPFKDVSENDWFYDAVKFVSEKGLFNGMSIDEFGPEVTLTRGMLVTILYRLEGTPATNKSIPFADVDMSKYYADPISWAKQNNIVNGIDETNFAPDAEITREQLATILYRYAKAKGMDVSVGEDTNILSYDDANEFSEYSIEALQWACGAGIVKGRTESTIVPKGNAKRCEVATMFLRFIGE